MRKLVRQHALLAGLLMALALMTKVLVPVGFMPSAAKDGTITVRICAGQLLEATTMKIALPGLPPQHDNQSPAKAEMLCAFAGLAMAMVASVDPALLALALAFVLVLALRPSATPKLSQTGYLRPPSRGPPATF